MFSELTPPERLQPYDRRVPTKFEKLFSFGVVSLVTLLGILILVGILRINPRFKVLLGLILVGYGVVRLGMLQSRYRNMERENNVNKQTKEDERNQRNLIENS